MKLKIFEVKCIENNQKRDDVATTIREFEVLETLAIKSRWTRCAMKKDEADFVAGSTEHTLKEEEFEAMFATVIGAPK